MTIIFILLCSVPPSCVHTTKPLGARATVKHQTLAGDRLSGNVARKEGRILLWPVQSHTRWDALLVFNIPRAVLQCLCFSLRIVLSLLLQDLFVAVGQALTAHWPLVRNTGLVFETCTWSYLGRLDTEWNLPPEQQILLMATLMLRLHTDFCRDTAWLLERPHTLK